jgi:poly(3-hydroxybutyrate) depolymerase
MLATCVPALSRSTVESSTETWRSAARLSTDYWAGAIRRGAMPWDVASDAWRWSQAMNGRRPPTWSSPHEIVFETPITRLRDFSQGSKDNVVPTIVFPPQAGHDSCIVDYTSAQSQMKVLRAAGLTRLYSVDWVGATAQTRGTTIEDYLADLDRVLDEVAPNGGKVNLVGDCQGGWLATIYAALHPERMNTLTIAGAPIDFHAGEAEIHKYVELLGSTGDLSFYERMVANHGGVMKGEYLLGGFIAMQPENEVTRQLALLKHLDDAEHVARYTVFEDWFKHCQDIPGAFYLWIVEHLFSNNELVKGELHVGGELVDLGRIECPLFLLAGQKDHITPPDQVWAIAEHVGTPADKIQRELTAGGHLGLFMGREALRDHWPELMAGVLAASTAAVSPGEAKRAAKRAAPTRPPVIRPGY